MSLSARITRIEDHLHRTSVQTVDWSPCLDRLTDEQLDRLEALIRKIMPEGEDTMLSADFHLLTDDELDELKSLAATMGLDW